MSKNQQKLFTNKTVYIILSILRESISNINQVSIKSNQSYSNIYVFFKKLEEYKFIKKYQNKEYGLTSTGYSLYKLSCKYLKLKADLDDLNNSYLDLIKLLEVYRE